MKRTLSIVLLIASCLALIGSAIFCIDSICQINRTLHDLANDPSAGGIDYFGVGWSAGVCLFALSVLGLVLSEIAMKQLRQGVLRSVSLAVTVGFALLTLASIFLFYI